MNMRIIVLGTLIMLILFSCHYEDKIKILDTGKINADTLHGEIQFPVIAILAGDIIVFDSVLLVTTPFNPDGFFSIFSLDGRIIGTFNKRGRGPDEYIMPVPKKIGKNKLSLWDTNNIFSEILIEFDANNEIEFKLLYRHKINEPGYLVFRLNPELFVSTIHEKGLLALFKNNGQLFDYFGSNLLEIEPQNFHRYQGPIAVSDLGGTFVFGSSSLDYICAYEVNEMNQALLKWEYYLHQEPYYTLIDGDVIWDANNHVQGIKDIQIVNDKILVLYSGRSISLPRNQPEGAFSDNLYILNMKGELLNKYKLDIAVLKVSYSKNNSSIYGITMTDDWQIVKFDFPDINL
jgi:hypothetical protein